MIADITVASEEQSSGIEQVNKAITQMDEMTQQNAALVEEATAAGEAMAEQSRGMMKLMDFFTLSHSAGMMTGFVNSSEPTYSAPAIPVINNPHHSQGAAMSDSSDDEWQEF